MKRFVLFSLTAASLATGCAPTSEPSSASRSEKLERLSQALGNVSLAEENLSPELAAAVRNVAPACSYCSALDVHSFVIEDPSTGPVSVQDATETALTELYWGPTSYSYAGALSRATLRSQLNGYNYGSLLGDIESFVGTGETGYLTGKESWDYMTAPDYCEWGNFYALVFEGGRKVVTIEINGGNEC